MPSLWSSLSQYACVYVVKSEYKQCTVKEGRVPVNRPLCEKGQVYLLYTYLILYTRVIKLTEGT
jgi:hypothetical protein